MQCVVVDSVISTVHSGMRCPLCTTTVLMWTALMWGSWSTAVKQAVWQFHGRPEGDDPVAKIDIIQLLMMFEEVVDRIQPQFKRSDLRADRVAACVRYLLYENLDMEVFFIV
jgi:hypothetical protein